MYQTSTLHGLPLSLLPVTSSQDSHLISLSPSIPFIFTSLSVQHVCFFLAISITYSCFKLCLMPSLLTLSNFVTSSALLNYYISIACSYCHVLHPCSIGTTIPLKTLIFVPLISFFSEKDF